MFKWKQHFSFGEIKKILHSVTIDSKIFTTLTFRITWHKGGRSLLQIELNLHQLRYKLCYLRNLIQRNLVLCFVSTLLFSYTVDQVTTEIFLVVETRLAQFYTANLLFLFVTFRLKMCTILRYNIVTRVKDWFVQLVA